MVSPLVRTNSRALRYLNAGLFAGVTFLALSPTGFYPVWLSASLAVAVGGLAIASPSIASLLFVLAASIPMVAIDFVAGVAVLLAGLVATQYLASGLAGGVLLVALAAVSFPYHGAWAFAVLAGYLLGRGRGAGVAATICLVAVLGGLLLGIPLVGTVATGGTASALEWTTRLPASPLTFSWLPKAIADADPGRLVRTFARMQDPVRVLIQPLLWAAAAVVGAVFREKRSMLLSLVGVALGIATLAVGTAALAVAFGDLAALGGIAVTAGVSLVVALAITAITEIAFPLVQRKAKPVGKPTEGADVDDLLSMIAAAEDELAARHHVESVVLITDMKSFSAITEELGSVESAKLVQRHRDLLLPIISRHSGKGKSTGGDGLVAAFASAQDAVEAAMEMQRTLAAFSSSGMKAQELLIRAGIASGEVVVDKGGRPFLGSALNMAARVMDLADGGRIMVTGAVAAAVNVPEGVLSGHGDFKLKNIAEAVSVVEVLWQEAQSPQEIRAS